MPQISRRKLNKDVEKEVFTMFWNSLTKCKTAEDAGSFFSDLLTETEQVMLAKRYAIACLLLRKKTPSQITHILHVSFSTVRSVASWLKNAKPRTQTILEHHLKEEHWSEFIDRIDEIVDLLPPRYGTDWHQAGLEKWERTKKRASRNALR